MERRVGEGAAVGRPRPADGSDGPVELVPGQNAVVYKVEGLSRYALVVDGHGGQPVRSGPVPGDVHDLGAVLEGPELVEGGERSTGVGRFVAHGPVELGGMADRLVDGEPQIGRVDHQVVPAGIDRRRPDLLGQQFGKHVEFVLPVPAGAEEVLPTPAHRRCHCPHALEAADRVDGEHLDDGMDPDPALGGFGPGQIGVEGVLGHGQDLGGHVVDHIGAQQLLAPPGQKADLVGQRYLDRIDTVGGGPGDHAVAGLSGQIDPGPAGPGDDPGGVDRPDHQFGGRPGPGGHRGREAHGSVHHHPDPHAQLGVVGRPLQSAVPEADLLGADALDMELGVGTAVPLGLGPHRLAGRGQLAGAEGAGGRDGRHGRDDRRRPDHRRSGDAGPDRGRPARGSGPRVPYGRDPRPAHPGRLGGDHPAARGGHLGLGRPVHLGHGRLRRAG